MNRLKRLFFSFLSLLLVLHPKEPSKRSQLFGKYHVFGSVGKQCILQGWRVPLYSNLIFIHDNVSMAPSVKFVAHDGIHRMLNNKYGQMSFIEKLGCIEIMDNVFISSNVTILNNTRIGCNVIIGANSVVNKDLPGNAVYAGTPARRICSFDEYVEKHRHYSETFRSKFGIDQVHGVDKVLAAKLREDFIKQREG